MIQRAVPRFAPFARTQYQTPQSRILHRTHQARRIGNTTRPPPHSNHGTPRQTRLRKPPLFSWERQGRLFVYTGGAFLFVKFIAPQFISISFEEVEEEEKGTGEGEEEVDDEEVEDGLFIPCGWPTKQKRVYYKASDPEWKEFVKFSKDKGKHADVQKRLVSAIRSEVAALPGSKRSIGTIDPTKGRYWLEIIFPDGPPQDYQVPGIEITDHFVAWSLKTVTQKEYAQLHRTMVPTAALWASWASFKYHLGNQANRVRTYFGLEPKIDPEIAMLKAHLAGHPDLKAQSTKQITSSSSSASQASEGSKIPDSAATTKGYFDDLVPRGDTNPITRILFLRNLKKNQTKASIEPPRGSVVVTGLIEIIGCHGRMTLDVSAAFDPKKGEYLMWNWKPRRVQPKQQRPKGGA